MFKKFVILAVFVLEIVGSSLKALKLREEKYG